VAFEILHGLLVFLRGRSRIEGAEVSSSASLMADLGSLLCPEKSKELEKLRAKVDACRKRSTAYSVCREEWLMVELPLESTPISSGSTARNASRVRFGEYLGN